MARTRPAPWTAGTEAAETPRGPLAAASRRLKRIERARQMTPHRLSQIEQQAKTTRVVRRMSRKLLAYELFIGGATRAEIAAKQGWTTQYVDQLAKTDQWETRRLGCLGVDPAALAEMEGVITQFRQRVSVRIQELDALCRDGKVAAILGWLDRAGVPKSGQWEVKDLRKTELINDIQVGVRVTVTPDTGADPLAPPPSSPGPTATGPSVVPTLADLARSEAAVEGRD